MNKKLSALALTAILATTLAGCKSDVQAYEKHYPSMGATASLILTDVEKRTFNSVEEEVGAMLLAAENSLSATLKTSSIYAFNTAEAGARVELDKTAYDVLTLAKEAHVLTNGYYNPAVYYSVQAYGFDAASKAYPQTEELPTEERLAAYVSLSSHFSEIVLKEEDGKYFAQKPAHTVQVNGEVLSMQIDLGGIGKGWCTDRVNEILNKYSVSYGKFIFGSSSILAKKYYKTGGAYEVSAKDPIKKSLYFCSFKLQDSVLSTSGSYEKSYEIGSKTYCHIIDPFTGSPIQTGTASVTVIGGSAALNDALTTALSAMDKSKAVQFINENLKDRRVIMLTFEEGQGKVITNCPQDIGVLNKDYKIINTVENGQIVLN